MATETGTTCVVCWLGEIVRIAYEDYHCNTCGLKYRFLPSQTLSPPKSDDSKIQIQPGLFVAKHATAVFSKDR
ncbi:MAG: hypothetical protein A2651_01705 [Candidatus Yanofskybacteria bacterium RIFCSPHIGHO2_01_FULL_42_12]|uniref:Uncharacterized protein n=1 Tax=Candidatus Yanofskybacteria bacterium RIFCSPLOWO2_01_FULL_42_49 TaxID=1802694 RepID=A0A1F8GCQ5_9BACT|nr:MAG: hypothetical protein A2651_01705 [Candidatus Yanofskybacteria bacterium RIFCSPHIGHO2_01_FULL_42_12]OGN23142.1 MAG: hypothetical protein A2918_03835 [Candidatus Yanofskybacteria bacterium RIFCSPLOWO2_01_FULL_42_49]